MTSAMIVWAGAEGGSPDAPGGFATSDVFEESFAAITDRNFAGVATRVRATADRRGTVATWQRHWAGCGLVNGAQSE